jgi:hypothetical protein
MNYNKTTMDDVSSYTFNKNSNIEYKKIKTGIHISECCGRSRDIVTCPFCGEKITLYTWRCGGGKRCECCGAMILGCDGYRIIDRTKRKKIKTSSVPLYLL